MLIVVNLKKFLWSSNLNFWGSNNHKKLESRVKFFWVKIWWTSFKPFWRFVYWFLHQPLNKLGCPFLEGFVTIQPFANLEYGPRTELLILNDDIKFNLEKCWENCNNESTVSRNKCTIFPLFLSHSEFQSTKSK